jgi:hypothetical protein
MVLVDLIELFQEGNLLYRPYFTITYIRGVRYSVSLSISNGRVCMPFVGG